MIRNNPRRKAIGMTRLLTLVGAGAIVAAFVWINPNSSLAQTTQAQKLDPALIVPTTKLLAIGTFTAKATPSESNALLPSEMRQTAQLYLAGKIDQWYVKQDQSGVVFILTVTDPREAHELLAKLPLGRAGLMEFQLIPMGPLSPMRSLLSESPK